MAENVTGASTSKVTAGASVGLRPCVSWRAAVILSVGAALQITVVLGFMAQDLGNYQILVWSGVALVGALQCYLLAELATFFPTRSGGTATYPHAAIGGRAPWLSALAGWGYWFAWTPGIAVNLILAAEYLHATVAPRLNTLAFCLVVGGAIYWCNARGLRLTINLAVVLGVLVGLPLLAIVASPLREPALFHWANIAPLHLPSATAHHGTLGTVIKWIFVATWSAYGAEIASTVLAEVHHPVGRALRTMTCAGLVGVAAFTIVPIAMTGIVGSTGLAEDPTTVFLRPAQVVFGPAGKTIVGLMLAGALALGAQAYVVASSRTVYQMAHDGYLPAALGRLSKRGVPVMSAVFDAVVITALVLIFGTNLVSVVAAANIGYLVVFVVVPLTSVIARRQRRLDGVPTLLPRWWTAVGFSAAAVNLVLLVVGGYLWGPKVWLTGGLTTLAILPMFAARRWSDRRRAAKILSVRAVEGAVR